MKTGLLLLVILSLMALMAIVLMPPMLYLVLKLKGEYHGFTVDESFTLSKGQKKFILTYWSLHSAVMIAIAVVLLIGSSKVNYGTTYCDQTFEISSLVVEDAPVASSKDYVVSCLVEKDGVLEKMTVLVDKENLNIINSDEETSKMVVTTKCNSESFHEYWGNFDENVNFTFCV